MRRALFALALLTAPLSALAQDVETDTVKVFSGAWVQLKDPAQNGLLSYLTQERAAQGEYFSIRCENGDRSVRLGYPGKLPPANGGTTGEGYEAEVPLSVDGRTATYRVAYTGPTQDKQLVQGTLHGYRVLFNDAAARDGFLRSLSTGTRLTIGGHTLPVSLAGSAQAIQEQAAYCK